MKALRLYCNTSDLPRRVYLFDNEEDIPKAYPNSFVLRGVDWSKSPSLLARAQKDGHDLTAYSHTVFPFGIRRDPDGTYGPLKATLKKTARTCFLNREFAEFAEAILPRINSMSMYLNGVKYQSPCEMCHDLLSHVYGRCDIAPGLRKHCHFSLMFPAKAVSKAFVPPALASSTT